MQFLVRLQAENLRNFKKNISYFMVIFQGFERRFHND